ncbi:UDP-N-acetylmuramoyl-tripeptide--D-alanyl-D-alanine ligase (EC [Olavius sp. associated proteobacterium Delta 1]|nr:UDP-N-acetylmuramoyl-tripeptide--D-alanyl-D-alanine ligase (EC [Olavius sp. associated proteobacterium Delta 1]
MTSSHPIPWTTAEILEATAGELVSGDLQRAFAKVYIDSRMTADDGVFVAITGEIHDGHKFLPEVVDQGVRGLVINREKTEHLPLAAWKKMGAACIAVADTTRALGDMAAFNRRRSHASVVGITGSNGKTTTRQLTATVVSQQYNTLATAGNFNNEIGLPLTLLGLASDHQWAVVELGTNNPGEIARLADICSPDIGVITNIGPAHLEGLGSIEGVAREKGSLLNGLRKNGKAVLNADDPRVLQLARQSRHEVVLYGLSADAAVRATDVHENEEGISFTLNLADKNISIRLNSPGRFMATNALAAAAVGYQLGLSGSTIKAGLEAFRPVGGRMNILHTLNGIHIIDDTYNANPDSMQVALSTLKTMRAGSRGIFVAGDMLELGDQAPSLHGKIGAMAARSGIRRLYAKGEFADQVVCGARDEGMPAANTITGSRQEIIADLTGWLGPGDWVLVKGSRGMAMEKVVEGIKAWAEGSRG